MDVYLPKNRSRATKTIIYVHGGGWYMGDKADIRDGAIYFQQQGFAFISINYRLTRTAENNIHPAQMQDIDKIIAYISQKQLEWSLSDDKLAFFGGSAGAHLSMLYAYKYNLNKKIKAVISVAGPTDLTDSMLITSSIGGFSIGAMIESYVGVSIAQEITAWRDASPINFITADSTPTLFVHGTIDTAVPYHQSLWAYNKLSDAGGVAQIEPLPNVGHDLVGTNWSDLLPKMIGFLNLHTK
ncbi:MAG: alpha/beta hydrolase [Microscillaceae bacterium]|nr:alpha/beta hydrolase [Microscillaceae bacterium]